MDLMEVTRISTFIASGWPNVCGYATLAYV